MRLPAGSLAVALLLPLAALAALSRPAHAQAVELALRDDLGQPIGGARVSLLRDTAAVSHAITRHDGRATLGAGAPGSYRLLVRRIGFRPDTSAPMLLAEAERRPVELAVRGRRVTLEAVHVDASKRCVARDQAGGVAQLWEQVRTALEVSEATNAAGTVPIELTVTDRRLRTDGSEETRTLVRQARTRSRPFSAEEPARLAESGFVIDSGTATRFFAPDERVLLSDEFADAHCYGVAVGRDERAGQLGLTFRPRDRKRADVTGTLWVEQATAELRALEFDYVNTDRPAPAPLAGGRLRFARLATGAWIVDEWSITMPVWRQSERRPATPYGVSRRRVELAGYVQRAGRAVPLDEPAGAP